MPLGKIQSKDGHKSMQDFDDVIMDDGGSKAKSEAVRYLFDFPDEWRMRMTRWRKREIPLIAAQMTLEIAGLPNRPRDVNGKRILLSEYYRMCLAELRLAEEGAMRGEGMSIFQTQIEEKAEADALKD